MDDDTPNPDELEQLARSLLMHGSLGRRDAQRVAECAAGGCVSSTASDEWLIRARGALGVAGRSETAPCKTDWSWPT